MEDFIYIILGIVWLVISVIGGVKKKQAQGPTGKTYLPNAEPYDEPTVAPDPETNIEDMLDDFFGTGKNKPKKEVEPTYQQEEYTFEQEEVIPHTYEEEVRTELPKYETKYSIGPDYEFSAEGHIETLDEIIEQYRMSDQKAVEEDSKVSVEDLDSSGAIPQGFVFDARQAVIYSEILNRKYA